MPATSLETLFEAAVDNDAADFLAQRRNLPARLLAYLRDRFESDRIGYASPPTPIKGGTDILTFRFQLSHAPPRLEPPLVLRLYSKGKNTQRAIMESAVQNALVRQGYPAPPVYATCTDMKVLNGAFLIMRFLPGRPLLFSALEAIPDMLGRVHAALHNVDPAPVAEALHAQGLDPARHRFTSSLDTLCEFAAARESLVPVVEWLSANRPPEAARLSICHGDFHPMNLLVHDHEVAGVLDWSDIVFADPVLDVASTSLLLRLAGRHVLSLPDLDREIEKYLAAYRAVRPLPPDHLDYYRVRRCVLVCMNAAGRSLLWNRPGVIHDVADEIRRVTGSALKLKESYIFERSGNAVKVYSVV